MLLDTQFLIEFQRELDAGRMGRARTFLTRHRRRPLLVSVVSLGEIAAGMPDSDTAREFAGSFRRILNLFPELALTAAQVDRELIQEGNRLGENDNWLAGTCRYYGQPIVSNDDDFDRVRGLRRIPF
jgi:predicted nucleic acid-binding protein